MSPVMKPPLNKDTQLVIIARYQTSHTGRHAPPRILCSASLLAEHPKHQDVPKVLLKATREAPRAPVGAHRPQCRYVPRGNRMDHR